MVYCCVAGGNLADGAAVAAPALFEITGEAAFLGSCCCAQMRARAGLGGALCTTSPAVDTLVVAVA
eukprot:6640296-Alexandrium_andersonii.AAC.1